ncbi:MAG: nucleotidyltransferase domain-containing protein [Deltaproteobacteria bacterium]|nr:nucleotidyltransferase domain-containing protein [Deltaproteobacteria bacterium]
MAQAKAAIKKIIAQYIRNLEALGLPIERVYLFGSQAQRQANQESDLDLAVVSPLFEKMSLWDRAGFLGKAAWDIKHPMDVLGFAPSQLKKAAPGTLLNHIMRHGIEIIH